MIALVVSWDHPDSLQLCKAQRTEISDLGGVDPGVPPTASDMAVLLVAYKDDVPIGCGGIRHLPAVPDGPQHVAEIKRMFVNPVYRGKCGLERSVASYILDALENAALQRGCSKLKLETGCFLHQARSFYERCGFVECALYGSYVGSTDSVCYEKELAVISQLPKSSS
ncbi:putative GCN5-related N-acetyltransferase [Polychaeton citri CBS 116435]|uniref:GCN5-related N-acetyltransferase n=1 Tax=Polychaeton citri CBS 116435 TaxID=1314669 RepID=A0A9P4Q8L1_9PEZI|nr:putative GCN5-related N-acetyltransferase [Polychaeton citri CBS 116435]